MRERNRLVVLGILASCAAACAGFRVIPHPGEDEEGLRFYRPEPYLLVTLKVTPVKDMKDPIVEPVVSTLWLPDYGKEYAVRTWAWFAKGDFQFTLADGWRLTQANAKTDTTDALSKLVDLVSKGTEAGAFFPAAAGDGKVGARVAMPDVETYVMLFRVRFEDGGVRLEKVSMK